jgi:hypothetical protein
MTPVPAQSLVLVTDYRVPDPGRVWPLLQRRKAALADLGAHHVLVYTSTTEPGRVLVTIGIRTREPVLELLRSRAFFDWFDEVGVQDLPAVFAGELIERLNFSDELMAAAPGVVVAATTPVDDVSMLSDQVKRAENDFRRAGVRKLWLFQAFDDPREVFTLQEIDDENSARSWIERPDTAADWLSAAGVGAYPPLFIGRFQHMMRIDEADRAGGR